MTTEKEIVAKAIKEIRGVHFMKYHDEFVSKAKEIVKILTEAAATEVLLAKRATSMIMEKDVTSMEKEILEIIGLDGVNMLKEAFLAETYTINLTHHDDGLHADLSKNGEKYTETIVMRDQSSGMLVIIYQSISILVELILFLLSANGIRANLNEIAAMRSVERVLQSTVRSSAVQQAIDVFANAWNQAGANTLTRAMALYDLLRNTYVCGALWTIFMSVISEMNIVDHIRAIVRVALMLVAAFTTGGFALIARIIVAIDSSVPSLFRKVLNLGTLSDREKKIINALLRSLGLPEI